MRNVTILTQFYFVHVIHMADEKAVEHIHIKALQRKHWFFHVYTETTRSYEDVDFVFARTFLWLFELHKA